MDTTHWSTSRLLSTAARLNENRDNERLRSLGVTHSGVTILKVLASMETISQVELAEVVRVQAQTIGKSLERLENRELVRRCKSEIDRRVTYVAITAAGREVLGAVQRGEGAPVGGDRLAEEELRTALMNVINSTRDGLLVSAMAANEPDLADIA
ncbi:hypothetical protein GCM10027403_03090 [Arthrobacter tecti]